MKKISKKRIFKFINLAFKNKKDLRLYLFSLRQNIPIYPRYSKYNSLNRCDRLTDSNINTRLTINLVLFVFIVNTLFTINTHENHITS